MNRIIFATGNAGKMKEIREILGEDMPTAFVCNNDEIACILIEKLEKMGYSHI